MSLPTLPEPQNVQKVLSLIFDFIFICFSVAPHNLLNFISFIMGKIVIVPHPNDVICGRGGKGGKIFENFGNKNYRNLIKISAVCMPCELLVSPTFSILYQTN